MTDKPPKICPHCGQSTPDENAGPSGNISARDNSPAPEYDHRGVLMPRRTRVGGIVIPQ